MKPAELLAVLRDVYAEKLALKMRHEAGALLVSDYELNNTYQYIIAREDMQLAWIGTAIGELDGSPPEPRSVSVPSSDGDRLRAILEDDARQSQGFVDRWRPRVEAMSHARHARMLQVVLGETLEHKRFFEQALAGRRDLLGRRPDGASTGGGVLPTRWLE